LTGANVNDVPLDERCIGPISLAHRPLFVGRKHQPELLRNAVEKECLQFLSRDHFRISLDEGGGFQMLVLTQNPIWRDRREGASAELARGDVIDLRPGDIIALGTGGETSTLDEARQSLCWIFRRASAQDKLVLRSSPGYRGGGEDGVKSSPSPSPSPPQDRRPRSPGGPGPRVSDSPAWGATGSKRHASPVRGGSGFQPMLPPAAELLSGGGGGGSRGGGKEDYGCSGR